MPSVIVQGEEPSSLLKAPSNPTSMTKSLNFMISSLNDEELEIAAKTSFQYARNPDAKKTIYYAKRMATRYLISKKNVDTALEKMKATIAFRKKIDVDGLRLAFDDPSSDYQEVLEKRLERQAHFVQGYDKAGRSTHVFVARRSPGDSHCAEWTLKEAIYTMERAIACSRAEDSSVNAIIDLNGFSMGKHAPPLSIAKDFLTTLRSHYAGQVNKIFLLDAPYCFNLIWNLVKPFVGKTTAQKMQFLSGLQKEAMLSRWYSKEDVSWFVKCTDSKDFAFDTTEYLHVIPFDRTFDYQKGNKSQPSLAFSILAGKIPMNDFSNEPVLISSPTTA